MALDKATDRKPEPERDPPRDGAARNDDDVGSALRAIYQDAADEAIPPEMLDLLSKLK